MILRSLKGEGTTYRGISIAPSHDLSEFDGGTRGDLP